MDYSRHPDVTKDVAKKQPWRQYRDILISETVNQTDYLIYILDNASSRGRDCLWNWKSRVRKFFRGIYILNVWNTSGKDLYSSKTNRDYALTNMINIFAPLYKHSWVRAHTLHVVCSTKHDRSKESKSIHWKFLDVILFETSSTFLGIFLRNFFGDNSTA